MSKHIVHVWRFYNGVDGSFARFELQHEEVDGFHTLTCEGIPGFIVVRESLGEALETAPRVIEQLCLLNEGVRCVAKHADRCSSARSRSGRPLVEADRTLVEEQLVRVKELEARNKQLEAIVDGTVKAFMSAYGAGLLEKLDELTDRNPGSLHDIVRNKLLYALEHIALGGIRNVK